MTPRLWLVVALSVVFLGSLSCSRDTVSRSGWEGMTPEQRVLYVRSLVGAERAKEAKSGTGKAYDRPAEEYVAEIERAYSRGDERRVHLIFEELEPSR